MVSKSAWAWLRCACLLVALGCGRREPPVAEPSRAAPASASPVAAPDLPAGPKAEPPRRPVHCVRFRDIHKQARLEHVYLNGERGMCMLMETTGGGAGWLDYDADGRWDLYLNQGGDPKREPDAGQPNDKLFRNRPDGTFEDVTDYARIVEFRYSQGVAVGDYDNDGFDDVYVTSIHGNTLFHNQGDGTFIDVTGRAGVFDGRWSASAAWADLDLDGNLDLYVCNYCLFDPKRPRLCRDKKGQLHVCHPREVPPLPDECYMSRGDGTFAPEAKKRGMVDEGGRGLGVAVADFNNDGWPDVFVTNDTTANFLFVNQGKGMFQESGMVLGCAADANGSFMANMGVAAYDFFRSGNLDLYVTHFTDESDTLFRNYGEGGFQDESATLGLRGPTLDHLSFGVVAADFDQDGLPELFVTSGHIENAPGYPLYRMSPLLLAFDGSRFHDCSKQAGEFFQKKYVGRAVAACDYDDDGKLELLVAHENSPAALLHVEPPCGHWLKFFMRGRQSNRRGIGCRITVKAGRGTAAEPTPLSRSGSGAADDKTPLSRSGSGAGDDKSPLSRFGRGAGGEEILMQELCGGTSYCATHQPALVFGLGESNEPCTATVRWPSGLIQTLQKLPVDSTVVLDESHARRAD